VIWDLAPHDISILLHVLDRLPVNVSARGSACVQPGVHDVAYLELLFPDGVAAQVHVSWLEPSKVRRVTVVGDSKMAVFNDVAAVEKVRIYDMGVLVPGDGQPEYRHGEVRIPHIPWTEPLRRQCEHFAACLTTQQRPVSDGAQGLAVVAVLEAANRSLAAGGVRMPVSVPRLPIAASEATLAASDATLAAPDLVAAVTLPQAAG
jgi:predicted dehydrogenase